MTFDWLDELNVVEAAQQLLALEVSCIDEIYQADRLCWVESLKQALNNYLNHAALAKTGENKAHATLPMNSLAHQRLLLLKHTRAFLPLLTRHGTELLQQAINKKVKDEYNAPITLGE